MNIIMCDDCQNPPKREGQNADGQTFVLCYNFFFQESLFLIEEMIWASETIDLWRVIVQCLNRQKHSTNSKLC